jgi:hypothetical protein
MTHQQLNVDSYIARAANALPNGPDPDLVDITVDDIMRERQIGKKYAYAIFRQIQMKRHTGPVPTNQREAVLTVLYRSEGRIKNSQDLLEILLSEGHKIDGHDTSKTLWSLQKTEHVRFRERQHPRKLLYAIHLTKQGRAEAERLLHGPEREKVEVTERLTAWAEPAPEAERPGAGPTDLSDVAEVEHQLDVPAIHNRPWVNGSLGGFPAFRDVRDRYVKSRKLTEAAKLLEEAGEDEMALQLMTKTEFNALEQDVIAVLKYFEEIA